MIHSTDNNWRVLIGAGELIRTPKSNIASRRRQEFPKRDVKSARGIESSQITKRPRSTSRRLEGIKAIWIIRFIHGRAHCVM